MEYQVPQFIEVEDKIFGPLTFKQFVYLAGGAGACVIIYLYLPLLFAVLLIIPVAAFAAALAFYRINNKPFIDIMESGFSYMTGGKLYLWKKDEAPIEPAAQPAPIANPQARAKLGLNSGRLHELAWSLDVKDQHPETE